MAFIDDFIDVMPHQIGVERKTGVNGYGEPTFASLKLYAGYVNPRSREVVGAGGNRIFSNTTVYLATIDTITTEDRVTLPDGTTPNLIGVQVMSDENGPDHTVLFC